MNYYAKRGFLVENNEIIGDKNNVLGLKLGIFPFILVILESSDEYPQSPGIYLLSNEQEGFVGEFSLKGLTSTNPNWTQTIPSLNSNNKYLWSYEKIIFTDGSKTESKPVIISRYSADGKSAYQLWLDAGNTGTEEDYLNSLKIFQLF